MAYERHRWLDVERVVDREHLTRDAEQITRVSHRYAARLATAPGNPSAEIAGQCVSTLIDSVAAVHGLAHDVVRRAMTNER